VGCVLGGCYSSWDFPARERQMNDREEQAKRRLYEISKGLPVIGIGFLYLLSVWVNHDPLRP
jgi:hypothetical protein